MTNRRPLLVSGHTRRLSVGGALLSTVVIIAIVGCTDPNVLATPERGETSTEVIEGGRPVFVVHDLDGNIYVVDGASTHLRGDQMAWCPSSRTIDDVFHGARWDPAGRYVSGPGRSDLGRYEFELTNGDSALIVQRLTQPATRTESPTGMAGPPCEGDDYQLHPHRITD